MVHQQGFEVATRGRGTTDISREVGEVIRASGIRTGLCQVFCHHTSASLILCENADPRVRVDLETFMSRLVPDGDPAYLHDDEGPDDMPAHVRTVLTQSGLSFPLRDGRLLDSAHRSLPASVAQRKPTLVNASSGGLAPR